MFVNGSLRSVNWWGKFLGQLVYFFDIYNRRIIRNNLGLAFPDWSPKKIKINIKRVYQHFAISVLETFQALWLSGEEIIERVQITGENHLHQALRKEKGIILVSAHIGNWEVGTQLLACRFAKQIILVAKRLKPLLLNDLAIYSREKFGSKVIDNKGTFNEMIKTLRHGNMLLLMADLPRKKYSVEVNFFGHRARSAYSVALLAIRCKSPIIPFFAFRDIDGSINVELNAAIDIKQTGSLRTDLQVNTQRITDKVEEAVRRHPDQYLWLQKRWKDYYPHLYPSYYASQKKSSCRKLKQPYLMN